MLASQLGHEDTHKPSMFQSYIKVIFSYLKLSYFILNLCIAEQLFTPHISVVYFISSQIRQSLNKTTWMVNWLCKRVGSVESWFCKAIQCRLGQVRACKCNPGLTYIAVSQRRLTARNIKISCPCSIQNIQLPNVCHGIRRMHDA